MRCNRYRWLKVGAGSKSRCSSSPQKVVRKKMLNRENESAQAQSRVGAELSEACLTHVAAGLFEKTSQQNYILPVGLEPTTYGS